MTIRNLTNEILWEPTVATTEIPKLCKIEYINHIQNIRQKKVIFLFPLHIIHLKPFYEINKNETVVHTRIFGNTHVFAVENAALQTEISLYSLTANTWLYLEGTTYILN